MGRNNKKNFRRDKNNYKNQTHPQYQSAKYQNPVHRNMAIQSDEMQKLDEAQRELKSRHVICAKCGEPITDLASAMSDRTSGEPIHFDCVMSELVRGENLRDGERVAYIGNGKFAVIKFESAHDYRHFKIIKTIEWESHDKPIAWRDEMASLYSQVV